MNVLVVYGGDTDEHEVSIASGRDVVVSLRAHGDLDVATAFIDRTGGWHLDPEAGDGLVADAPRADAADADRTAADVLDALAPGTVVFPVLHGGWGEGGGLQREVEARPLGLVGCGSDAAAAGLAKLRAQRLCADAGLAVIPTVAVGRDEFAADPDAMAAAGRGEVVGDIVVKPGSGGSSVGVHTIRAGQSIRAALTDVLDRDPVALVQPRVAGREMSVGVWNDEQGRPRATGASLLRLPVGGETDGFTYAHKYQGAGGVLEIPADVAPVLLDALRRAALRAFAALGCRDLARVDFFVTRGGGILLNEINTMPGLRRQSHFSRLVAAAGVGYDRLLRGMVAAAAARCAVPSAR